MATAGTKIIGSNEVYSWVKYSTNRVIIRMNGLYLATVNESQARRVLGL